MMIGRMLLVAATAALLTPAATAMAQNHSFACEGGGDDKEIQARASNFSMQLIMGIYRDRWDGAYARAQCEAFASGKPYTIKCLDDVRDWDAIEASIPDDYYGMGRFELAEFVPQEEEKGRGYREAFAYCREVGAIK